MPQKGQIKHKKQYGVWCYSYEEWGIVEYKVREGHPNNQEEGPFNTFREAKKFLTDTLRRRYYDYKRGFKEAMKLKLSDV